MYKKNVFKKNRKTDTGLKKIELFKNDRISVESYNFAPGQEFALHRHPAGTQAVFIMMGTGEFYVQKNGEELLTIRISSGDVIFLEEETWHGIKNTGDRTLVVSQVSTDNCGMEVKN